MQIEVPWLSRPSLRAVLSALDGRALVVGGAVRNACLGQPPGDIDLATPLTPDQTMRCLEAAGLKAIPTGIDHGTVTAIADHEPYEVTTYRADVETDGRHAIVRFSTAIEEDAARRDFTINALYLGQDGILIDPLGGLDDLRARRVRFIGDPHDRIIEDYLRILRFFRFSALYADAIDTHGLAASAALAKGLDGLARERIGAEMNKLLAAPDPAPAADAMFSAGILARALPGADPQLLAPLVAAENAAGPVPPNLSVRLGPQPDWRVRLASLDGTNPADALRLSRAEARFLDDVAGLLANPRPVAAGAHLVGAAEAHAAGLIRAAAGTLQLDPDFYQALAKGAEARMPLSAHDLIAAGMTEGPALGRALDCAKAAWVAAEFALDRDDLMREALK